MEYGIGIVLSGGNARGLVHVGVLEALREHGIEPECIAGTSAGAVVGALYAAGYSAEEMIGFFKEKNPYHLSNLAFGKPGFLDTEKVVADLLEYFPDDSFEALSRPLFIAATDIINARLEIFTSGPLIPAIVASSSIPFVFTPTEIGRRWFADGGIINNFPVEPLKVLCDAVIGVYAAPLRPVRKELLKTSFAVTYRAFEVAMYFGSKFKFHECDVLISPEELSSFGSFDTRHLRKIYEIGYEATVSRIDSILETLEARLAG